MSRTQKRRPDPVKTSQEPEPRERSKAWLSRAPLLAAGLAFFVYLPSVAGGFVYDDGDLILRNPSIRSLENLGVVLRYEPSRPLLNVTWALNYAFGGLDPWHYHLVNVLIHAGNAALLASLFLLMAQRLRLEQARSVALLGACLFAASPMAAETVAYVASRSSALSTLFTLASLRVATSVLSGGPRRRLFAAMGFFLLSLATKEEAAALPLMLILLDYFFVSGQRVVALKGRLWIHACFFAVLPLGLIARRLATGAWLPPPAIDPGLYLLTQTAAFPLYFFRAVIPLDPALYRGHPPATWPPGGATWAFLFLAAVIVLISAVWRRERPEWSFAVACLLAGLALPSSTIVSLNEMVVDHRAYLGSIGVAFALGVLLWKLGGFRLGLLVLAVLSARSFSYQWVLGDPVRAWEHSVARAPNAPDALCALAEAYAERGDPRAEELFLQATRLEPSNYRYWANLGVYYGDRGRLTQAVESLRLALQRKGDASVHDYRGQILLQLGRDDEAAFEFEAAISSEPTFATAYANLAALSLKRGDEQKARKLIDAGAPFVSDEEEAGLFARVRARLP